MTFSKRLKDARKKQGLTLSELGNRINKTEATIQRYESGNIKNLKNDTIEELANALKISPAYLMGWEDIKEETQEPTTIAMHLDGEDLTEEEWKDVQEYIDFIRQKRNK